MSVKNIKQDFKKVRDEGLSKEQKQKYFYIGCGVALVAFIAFAPVLLSATRTNEVELSLGWDFFFQVLQIVGGGIGLFLVFFGLFFWQLIGPFQKKVAEIDDVKVLQKNQGTQIEGLKEKQKEVSGDIKEQTQRIGNHILPLIGSNSESIRSKAKDVDGVKNGIDIIQSQIRGLVSNVESNTKLLDSKTKDIDQINQDIGGRIVPLINSNAESINSKANDISDIKEQITSIQSQVDKISIDISPDMELIRASERGDVKAVRVLIRHGADVNFKSKDRFTSGLPPLFLASMAGDVEVINMLIGAGADVKFKAGGDGLTALFFASSRGHSEIVRALIKAGIDVNIQSKQTRHTALFPACSEGHLETVKVLIEAGIKVNIQQKDGRTALFNAVGSRAYNIKIVEALIEAGVDVNIKDKYGDTALVMASCNGYIDCIKILLDNGAILGKALKRVYSSQSRVSNKDEVIRLLKEADERQSSKPSYP